MITYAPESLGGDKGPGFSDEALLIFPRVLKLKSQVVLEMKSFSLNRKQ